MQLSKPKMKPQRDRLFERSIVMAIVIGTVTFLYSSQRSEAMWAYVPLEVRIMEADFVVAGKIVRLEKDIPLKDGRVYEVGVIQVASVLKGKARTKEVKLAWIKPRKGGLRLADGPISYAVGQNSLWILRKDPDVGTHTANYPSDRQALANVQDLKRRLAAIKLIQWSKPQDGLQLGLFIEQQDLRKSKVKIKGKPVKAVGRLSVYALLKNVGKETIQVVNFHHDHPMSLEFLGPDGKPIEVTLYGKKPAKIPPPNKFSFLPVDSNQTRSIGYGLGLPTLTKSGEYTVVLKYKNARDGKPLDIKGVWRGEIESPVVKVAVPAKTSAKAAVGAGT